MVQPDALRLYALGCHFVSCPGKEGLSCIAYPGPVHDDGLLDIHFRSSRRLPMACDDLENHWRSRHARSLHLFPDVEEENRQRIARERLINE